MPPDCLWIYHPETITSSCPSAYSRLLKLYVAYAINTTKFATSEIQQQEFSAPKFKLVQSLKIPPTNDRI